MVTAKARLEAPRRTWLARLSPSQPTRNHALAIMRRKASKEIDEERVQLAYFVADDRFEVCARTPLVDPLARRRGRILQSCIHCDTNRASDVPHCTTRRHNSQEGSSSPSAALFCSDAGACSCPWCPGRTHHEP